MRAGKVVTHAVATLLIVGVGTGATACTSASGTDAPASDTSSTPAPANPTPSRQTPTHRADTGSSSPSPVRASPATPSPRPAVPSPATPKQTAPSAGGGPTEWPENATVEELRTMEPGVDRPKSSGETQCDWLREQGIAC